MYNLATNPYGQAAKKYVYELLGDTYKKEHDHIMERLCHFIHTEQDIREFADLLGALHSAGYVRAVNDNRDKLRELGYEVKIKPRD